MHHAEVVGGPAEAAVIQEPDGDFRIQTREHEYPLDADEPEVHIEAENVFVIKKAQIQPDDIKRLSNLEDAGIRGGIHSKRTYLMALKDGSLWVWKQTGVEERDEIFVYELAQRMFRKIVPEVQPVFVPKLGWGSAMRKVAGVPAGRVDGLHGYFHGNDEMMADLAAMLVLDYMTGNPDRHSNNWFLMHNDRLAAIDNGWAGEDLAMSFADVFQPARLAGMMEDERLWPQLLKGIAALIQDLEGRGDEVRALAEEIGIDKTEAVEMVRLWEPKLASMIKLIRSEAGRVEKARVYIEPGAQPPLGTQVETGPRGGTYYESEDIPAGMEEQEPPPAEDFGPQVLTKEALTEAEMFNDGVFQPWVDDYQDAKGLSTEKGLRETMKDDIVSRIAEVTGIEYETVNSFVKAWAGSATRSIESLAMQNAAAEMFGLKRNVYIKQEGTYRKPTGEMVENYGNWSRAIVKAMYDDTQAWLKENGVQSLVLFRGMRWTEDEVPAEVYRAGFGDDVDFFANPLSSWSSDPSTAEQFANMHAEGGEGEPDYEDENYQECLEQVKNEERESFINERRNNAEEEGKEPDFDDIESWEEEFESSYEEYDTGCEPPSIQPTQVRAVAVARVPADRIIALSCTGLGCLNEQEVVVAGGKQSVRMYSHSSEWGEDIEVDAWVEKEPEPEKPKTAQEQQEAQQHQWYTDNINPLFERLTQQQNALRDAYTLKMKEADVSEMPGKEKAALLGKLKADYWELHHETQADIMAEGKKLIEAAGYIPQGGWAVAEEAPLSPELAAWRKEHYSDWVETNLADDAQAWVNKRNDISNKYAQMNAKLRTLPPGGERHRKLIRLSEAHSTALSGLDEDYFRLGAKKIREAGFEPQGHFAERERLDAEAAGEKKALKKARVYLQPGQEPPGGQQVEEGLRGGRYYESEGRGAAEEEKPGARAMPPDEDAYWDMVELNDHYAHAGRTVATTMGYDEETVGASGWKDSLVRGKLKERLIRDIAEGTRMDVEIVSEFISSWASSSSDKNRYSLAMQMAAAKMFGSKPTSFVQEAWSAVEEEREAVRKVAESQFESWRRPAEAALKEGRATQEEYDSTMARAKAKLESDYEDIDRRYGQPLLDNADRILRYTYRQTQTWLKERGIKRVTLGRGQSWSHQEVPQDIKREPRRDWEEIRDKARVLIEKQAALQRRKRAELKANISAFSDEEYVAQKEQLYRKFDYNRSRINRWANMMMEGQGMWVGEVEFEQNPLSSWSSDPNTARQFSTMRLDDPELDLAVTMWAEVPAERIISVPFTGPGCLTENEFLVAGGKMPVHYRAAEISHQGLGGAAVHPVDAVRHHLNPWWQLGREKD